MKTTLFILTNIFSIIFLHPTFGQLNDTITISRIDKTIASYDVSLCVFNLFNQPDTSNIFLVTQPGLSNNLTVINSDTVPHNFNIDSFINSPLLQPQDTITINFTLPEGTFRFYSGTNYGKSLGASGIIRSGFNSNHNFYWNLFDTEQNQNQAIANGSQDSTTQPYTPDVFTINYNIYPNTTLDTTAKIEGNIGDSIVISIANSGFMTHPFHFHGYHIKILDAKISQNMIGWEKDSFPVLPSEAMTVLLVPDKPGTFPVHDHNLITVTTGGYPGGMITTININP